MLLSLTPTGGDEYVVIAEGATSDPHGFVLQAQDWGNAAWEHQFSGPRGTQGARPSQGVPANRTVRLQFRLYGSSTDDLAARIAEIELVMEALRRRGGTITRRAHGQTYRQHFEVLTTNGLQAGEWAPVADTRYILSPILEFVCAPYALGDPMAWQDVFADADTLDDYEVAQGAASALEASGGLLRVKATGGHMLVDARRGYSYGDVQVSTAIRWQSSASLTRRWGAILRYQDADNWVAATLEQDGAGTYYGRVRQCQAGVQAVLAEGSFGSMTTERVWIVGRIAGRTAQVQVSKLANSPAPPPSGPLHPVDGIVVVSASATIGGTFPLIEPGGSGRVGLYASPADAAGGDGWEEVRVQPLMLTGSGTVNMIRGALPLGCEIPGTAPALADVSVIRANESTGGAPRFALIGWAPHRSGRNLVGNGDFGTTGGTGAAGWVSTAVTGLHAAADLPVAPGGSGVGVLWMSTTLNSGASIPLGVHVAAGDRITARVDVRRTAATPHPVIQVVLGVSGDLAVSADHDTTPDADWHTVEVTWQAAAATDSASLVVRAAGTVGGLVEMRHVQAWPSHDEPSIPSQRDGRGAHGPLSIIRVADPGGLTVASSAGGTLSYTASGVSPLLPSSVQMVPTGAGHLAVSALIDPNLVGPDDYADGSLDVEVWLRAAATSTVVGPRCAVWAGHPAAAYDTDALGGRRAVAPWGLTGKPIVQPGYWRLYRIGVLSLDINPGNPAPWRVTARIAWAAGSTGSVNISGLILVPARSRALTPTGVVLSEGGYPAFIASAGGDGLTIVKRIASDGSGSVSAPPVPGEFADHGLGGSLLELPTGRVDMLAVFADQVPDDPTPVAASHVGHPSHLAIAVSPTPRWGHLRDI